MSNPTIARIVPGALYKYNTLLLCGKSASSWKEVKDKRDPPLSFMQPKPCMAHLVRRLILQARCKEQASRIKEHCSELEKQYTAWLPRILGEASGFNKLDSLETFLRRDSRLEICRFAKTLLDEISVINVEVPELDAIVASHGHAEWAKMSAGLGMGILDVVHWVPILPRFSIRVLFGRTSWIA